MKRTIWASVTVGLAALMTFGCGNVFDSSNGTNDNSPVSFTPGQTAANPFKIWAVDTNGQLFAFFSDNPGAITAKTAITGLPGGEKIVAIDCRPRTGVLYGITNTGKLHWINKNTGAAVLIGNGVNPAQVNADIDFNPVVDRIRQEADAQNVRIHPGTGALVAADTNLTINGQPANAVACAYTNPEEAPGSTQLFVITGATNRVYLQANPNDGILTQVGQLPVDIASNVGFDIAPGNVGFVAAQKLSDNFSTLLKFDPANGAATIESAIGGNVPVKSIAVDLSGPPVTRFVGIDSNKNLVRFDSSDPTNLLSSTVITGINEVIVGCDFTAGGSSASGLKVLGVPAGGGTGKIYTVNLATGAGTLVVPTTKTNWPDPAGASYGFEDRNGTLFVTVATGTETNSVITNPATSHFTVAANGATTDDGVQTYAAVDPLVQLGHTQSVFIPALGTSNNFQGGGNFFLYGVDVTSNGTTPFAEFLSLFPPQKLAQSIGEMALFTTKTCELDVDPAGNIFFASQRIVVSTGSNAVDGFSTLYRVSPTTGGAITVSRIGGQPIKNFAAIPALNANLTTGP